MVLQQSKIALLLVIAVAWADEAPEPGCLLQNQFINHNNFQEFARVAAQGVFLPRSASCVYVYGEPLGAPCLENLAETPSPGRPLKIIENDFARGVAGGC